MTSDIKRAFRGIIGDLDARRFYRKRDTNYAKYSATKHDGSRRFYGSPNPVSYFNICSFIESNWKTFSKRFANSPYSISSPRLGSEGDDRSIIIPSLSELSEKVSLNIKHSPFILKADISQFFPSLYTHSISWSAHGISQAKADTSIRSKLNNFNKLDFFVQNTQLMQTRGILIGPDAFRLVAEFIASDIDRKLQDRAGTLIIGGARHVDDFYIGVRSEVDALAVLSHLREVLQQYELQINDSKTKIINALEPIDDVWAQDLRAMPLRRFSLTHAEISHLLDKAFEISKQINSESPLKIALRRLDKERLYYRSEHWISIEPKLQRILHHFPHSIDYVSLLVVKRLAIGDEIDKDGWKSTIHYVLHKSISLNHHHEIAWLLWMMFVCDISIERDTLQELSKMRNTHILSLLVQAYIDNRCPYKPDIHLGAKLSSVDENWILNLVARSGGFTKASFSEDLKSEFEYLANKRVVLLDFNQHIDTVKKRETRAISKSRYGYDADDDDDDDGGFDDDDDDDDALVQLADPLDDL
ncbi:RNA-directed DNA polymerase [Inquilinus sp.]|uniref:RNA-directed DNA polymerase n=1 Tax=Inquilinus sp. TaxID=1932117 RepID=UPI003785276E